MANRMSFRPAALAAALALAGLPALAQDPTPRLPDGPHMGYITGFDPLGPRAPQVAALTEEALAAGMSLGRVQVDWADLEPRPGRFEDRELRAALAEAATGGRHVFVTLSTLDSDALTIPGDLLGPDRLMKPGTALDDAEVLARLDAFLDRFVPVLTEAGVWGLSVANEFDAPLNDGDVGRTETLSFLKHAMAGAKSRDPDLAVTVTYSGGAAFNNASEIFELNTYSDIVTYNTYCLSPALEVVGPEQWHVSLDTWKEAAADLPIFMQELGCPVGYGPDETGIGGALETQAAYVDWHIARIAEDPQLIGATWFQLLDWSPELSALYAKPLGDEGFDRLRARLEEWLATSGLCRWQDLSCGPAWDAWLSGMETIRAAREG